MHNNFYCNQLIAFSVVDRLAILLIDLTTVLIVIIVVVIIMVVEDNCRGGCRSRHSWASHNCWSLCSRRDLNDMTGKTSAPKLCRSRYSRQIGSNFLDPLSILLVQRLGRAVEQKSEKGEEGWILEKGFFQNAVRNATCNKAKYTT